MKLLCFFFLFSFSISQLFAQDATPAPQQATPLHRHKTVYYHASATELIFSSSQVENSAGKEFNPGLRFSGFFNQQEQYHFDFSKGFGIYTGIGIRNVGMINYPAPGVEVKQRAYSIGVPFAVKLGNLRRKTYVALGAEAEYFFNYKIKYFINGKKTKKSNTWFPDQVNPINPSVFVDLQSKSGFFIRFKYYLIDFLAQTPFLPLPNGGGEVPGYSSSSKLFYIGIGYNIKSSSVPKGKVSKKGDVDIKLFPST